MPYRRLPNTDAARLRALKKALQVSQEVSPVQLAFSQVTLYKLRSFLPSFEAAVLNYKRTYASSVTRNRDYPKLMRKAKLYISHFIQVLNMCIARGEMPVVIRDFFGLTEFGNKVPEMNTEADIIKWGEHVIAGETERMRKGMAPLTNPTIAVVKVRFENFMDAYHSKKINQKSTVRMQGDLKTLRVEADNFILSVWNEVETTFSDLPDDMMRERTQKYGLIYVFRKNEMAQKPQVFVREPTLF